MAEAEEAPAVPAVDDSEVDATPGYKAPEEKTMAEMLKQDTEDESLQKYKATLLGSANPANTIFWPDDPRRVIVKSISLVVEGRPDVTIDLTGDISALMKEKSFNVKEGAGYRLRINFNVQREIVTGLRLVLKTSKMGIRVDNTSHMMGSYGPKEEEQSCITPPDEAPSGLMARGSYKLSCSFLDDDKNSYLKWDLSLKITKDWE